MTKLTTTVKRVIVLSVLAWTYFVLFPEDLASLLAPLGVVLQVSNAASPWLYVLLAVAILSATAMRIWGRGPRRIGS